MDKNSYSPTILRETPEDAVSTRTSKWDPVIAHCKANPGKTFDVLEGLGKPLPTPDAMKRAGVKLSSRRTADGFYTMSAYFPISADKAAATEDDLF